eukprot:4005555-Pleurochrysis_carterae.AAC.2
MPSCTSHTQEAVAFLVIAKYAHNLLGHVHRELLGRIRGVLGNVQFVVSRSDARPDVIGATAAPAQVEEPRHEALARMHGFVERLVVRRIVMHALPALADLVLRHLFIRRRGRTHNSARGRPVLGLR